MLLLDDKYYGEWRGLVGIKKEIEFRNQDDDGSAGVFLYLNVDQDVPKAV